VVGFALLMLSGWESGETNLAGTSDVRCRNSSSFADRTVCGRESLATSLVCETFSELFSASVVVPKLSLDLSSNPLVCGTSCSSDDSSLLLFSEPVTNSDFPLGNSNVFEETVWSDVKRCVLATPLYNPCLLVDPISEPSSLTTR